MTDFDNYRILASSLIYTFTPEPVDEFRFGFTDEANGIRNELNGKPYTTAAGFQPISQTYPVSGISVIYFPGNASLRLRPATSVRHRRATCSSTPTT